VRAIVLPRHGGPDVFEVQERPDPPVAAGEVRIAVKAAGINFADTLARVGLYPDAPPTPCVLGYEVAGEIESVGEGVDSFKPGDRVFAGTLFGGQAELVTVSQDLAWPLPKGFSFEQGASIPVNYATAVAGLGIMGGLDRGERVLIHAAAGGVGIAATQYAKWRGAEIFGTASAGKHDAIREQGVDHAIDYRTQDFAVEVKRLTDGEGVDVIMDALGPVSFRKGYRLLRPGGRIIMYGLSEVQTGEKRDLRKMAATLARAPFATFPWWKSLAFMNENKGVFGLNMKSWWDQEGNLDRCVQPLIEGLDTGVFTPVVAEAFPFDRVAEAHRFLGEGRNIGKVVLVP
jgi:NADPH:quinone reductase-like Zn-dependent oxidoreductase